MKGIITYGFIIGLLLASLSEVRGQLVISQVSTWRKSLDASNLSIPDEAGADLDPVLETPSNFNQLDVLNMASSQGWKISVSKQDINWPAAFVPYLRRTDDGIPCPTCTGVNSLLSVPGYMQITNMEQDFIFGAGEVQDIDIQFKVEGLSLAVDAQSYATEIIYTIYGD